MRQIARLTTTYDMHEDRLRLSALDTEGRRMVLWLTQRLAGRIIAALIDQLDRALLAEGTPASAPALQLIAQASAALSPSPAAAAVHPAPSDEQHLLTRASLHRGDQGFALVFHWGEKREDCGMLAVEPARLRQWLGIFHRHYKQAEWPLEVWPRWFEEAAPKAVLSKHQLN